MTPARLGMLLALGGGVLLATTLLLLKVILRTLPAIDTVTYVYSFAALWHGLYFAIRRARGASLPSPGTLVAGGLIGLLDGAYNIALLSGLRVLGSAAHGFYSLLGEFFAVTLGVVILGERYNRREGMGWLSVVAGILIMRAHAEGGSGEGLLWMLLAGITFGTSTIVTRRFARTHSPTDIILTRTACVAILLGLLQLVRLRAPDPQELALLAVVGFLGPFLTGLCFIHALKRLEVGRVVTFRMSYAVLLPIGAWICFAKTPALREILGGGLMVAGCLVMIRERHAVR